MNFYFCGSYFRDYGKRKAYAADLDLNVVAAYPSKEMMIGPLVHVANPYQEKEGAYLIPNKKFYLLLERVDGFSFKSNQSSWARPLFRLSKLTALKPKLYLLKR